MAILLALMPVKDSFDCLLIREEEKRMAQQLHGNPPPSKSEYAKVSLTQWVHRW